MIFDKKIDSVVDLETAKKYFEELMEFGLCRGRIDGKDDDLKKYYLKQQKYLKKKGIDIHNIPNYQEKDFYPCGNCYLRFNSYIKSSIEARKNGQGETFQILYNKDNTAVYIVVDGELSLIQNDSINNKRFFNSYMINHENSKILGLDNGNYLITGPDGITEEVRDTNSNELIDNYFKKINERVEKKNK